MFNLWSPSLLTVVAVVLACEGPGQPSDQSPDLEGSDLSDLGGVGGDIGDVPEESGDTRPERLDLEAISDGPTDRRHDEGVARPVPDVTSALQWLGNPAGDYYQDEMAYARNPWDVMAHRGRLFVGAGNSSNLGPARNAGPAPIFAYVPAEEAFVDEGTVEDEQVDVFYVINGRIMTPGHDPLEGWELGNFYVRSDGGRWEKRRTIPSAIHTYAMTVFDDLWFAGLGTVLGSAVAISDDAGNTWEVQSSHGLRTHEFLQVSGGLFAANIFTEDDTFVGIAEYSTEEGGFVARADLDRSAILPGLIASPATELRVARPVFYDSAAVYIGAEVRNDHQYAPRGLFVARRLEVDARDVERVELPAEAGLPWDVGLHEDRVWALVNRLSSNGWRASVWSSSDLAHWRQVLITELPALARSAAFLDGDLYIGLGSEIENAFGWDSSEIHPDTGAIVRVPRSRFEW